MIDSNGPVNLYNADTLRPVTGATRAKPKGTPIVKHHKQYSTGELPVWIISACLDTQGRIDNAEATEALRHQLAMKELSSKEVRGSYKGVEERAFVINCSKNDALELGTFFKQESVLHLDTSRNATLHFIDGVRVSEPIGRFVSCSEEDARAGDAWTYDIGQDTYFHVV